MSNNKYKKYRSFLMLVRVSTENVHNITIPISLLVLDQTFEVLEDLAWLGEKLFLRWAIRPRASHQLNNENYPCRGNLAEAPGRVLSLCREIMDELRSYGRWRMVEVEVDKPKTLEFPQRSGKVRVYIDFI